MPEDQRGERLQEWGEALSAMLPRMPEGERGRVFDALENLHGDRLQEWGGALSAILPLMPQDQHGVVLDALENLHGDRLHEWVAVLYSILPLLPDDQRGRVLDPLENLHGERLREWAEAVSAMLPFLPDDQRGVVLDAVENLHGERLHKWIAVLSSILPRMSEDHRSTALEAVMDLGIHNMLQPGAMGKGAQRKRDQWNRVAGGRAGQLNYTLIGIAGALGAVAGLIFGLQVPPVGQAPMPLLMAVLGAPVGGYIGYLFGGAGAYHEGMMQVMVNERRSVTRPEMVTGQSRAWVPKVLLLWRAHEWRYQDGKPYLWLQLPVGRRIMQELSGTLDYLLQPNDQYRAKDAALYQQRNLNRAVSEAALDFADIDAGVLGDDNRLKELAPYLISAGFVFGGILLVLLTSG